MSTQDEQISNICDGIRAIQRNIARLSVTPDRSKTHQIMEQFCPGEGVLAKLRPPPGLRRTQRTLQRSGTDSESSDEGGYQVNTESESDDAKSPKPPVSLNQDLLDDPSSKGTLGEESALAYLRSIKNIIVSPPLLVWTSSNFLMLMAFYNRRQIDSKLNQ